MRRAFVAACAVALLAAGCAPSVKDDNKPFIVPQVGAPGIDVDTPALRALKKTTDVPDCQPGSVTNALPDVTLPCLGGGTAVPLRSLTGPLVINVWAYWCTPCRDEMPKYADFARLHPEVPVIGIDYGDFNPDEALGLARDSRVTFPLLADPEGLIGGRKLAVNPDRTLPIIVLVAADGSIAWQGYQQIHDVAELEGLVREHLGIDL